MDHLPNRPHWDCRAGCPSWPCETARAELTAEGREFPTTTRVYLAAQMDAAATDRLDTDLYARFLGW